MVRDEMERQLETFVNKYGAAFLTGLATKLGKQVELREEEVRLGSRQGLETYRFFNQTDWHMYGGMMRFDDGVRPIISEDFRLTMDCNFSDHADLKAYELGKNYDFVVLVGPSEEKDDAVLVTLHDGETDYVFSATYESREKALIVLALIHSLPRAVRFSELLSLGFSVHNP